MRRLVHNSSLVLPLCAFALSWPASTAAAPQSQPSLRQKVLEQTTVPSPSSPSSHPSPTLEERGLRSSGAPTSPNSPTTHEIPLMRQSLAMRLGLGASRERPRGSISSLGLHATWPRLLFPKLELGADLLSTGGGLVSLGYKNLWFDRTSLRPFVVLGPTLSVAPQEGLANLVHWRRLLARASIGFEDSLSERRSLRLEVQFLAGAAEQSLLIFAGQSWGF